ncbi:MAG: L-histidine N(alpha)-methyltransferase [Acidobacteriaceae bacterium]
MNAALALETRAAATLPLAAQSPSSSNVYAAVAAAVLNGLSVRPRSLPPWLFYDAAGSELFERITELPEYYITRMEREMFATRADEILAEAADGERITVVELGAGTATKTGLLLQAAVAKQGSVVYRPIDVSAASLEQARQHLQRAVPGVLVEPQVADYTSHLRIHSSVGRERRLVLSIGSSIGNFSPEEAVDLLERLRKQLRAGDSLLLGTDLAPCADDCANDFSNGAGKTVERLVAAYDDAAGVTAEFNLNLLRRLNREFGADFDPGAFKHFACWNAAESRIEMHLRSLRAQQATLPALDLRLDFAAGETIHTENSRKFQPEDVDALLRDTGFELARRWTDPAGWFGVQLAFAV